MRLFAISLSVLSLGACSTVSGAGKPTLDIYHGVTLIDPANEVVQPHSYIAVEGGRIVDIGKGRPPSVGRARLHDFKGRYAIPGLIDTHAHITLGPVEVRVENGKPEMLTPDRPDITAHNARQLLSYGITTIRNPAGNLQANRAYTRAIETGSLQGPEAFHAAEVIDRLPIPFEGLVTRVSPAMPMVEIVRRQAQEGASFVKLYTGLTEADIAEGIRAAHAHKLPAIAHLRDVSWTRAAELGIDMLVHMMPISPDLLPENRREAYRRNRRPGGFEFYEWYEAVDLDHPTIKNMIDTLARKKVDVNPTLVAFQPAFFGDRLDSLGLELDAVHPDMLPTWEKLRFDGGWKADDYRRAQAVWPKLLELTRRMYEAGVPLTIGTDLSNPFVPPGSSMAREMALHETAGIPTWSVLRLATSEGARMLRIGHRTGRLAVGFEADILFLNQNPLENLATVKNVAAVVNNGKLIDPRQLRSQPDGE